MGILVDADHLLRDGKRHLRMVDQLSKAIECGLEQDEPLYKIKPLNLIKPSFHFLNPNHKQLLSLIHNPMVKDYRNIIRHGRRPLLVQFHFNIDRRLRVADNVLLQLFASDRRFYNTGAADYIGLALRDVRVFLFGFEGWHWLGFRLWL